MIPRADIPNLVLPVAAVEAPTPLVAVADAKQEAFARLTQIAIGQQLQARVLSTYNDGSFLVRIADTAARMVLPTASRTGDSMLLTLIKKDPRPTFLMSDINPQDRESTEVSLSPASRKMQQELLPLKNSLQGEAAQISRGNVSAESPLNATNQRPEQNLPEGVKTSLSNAGKLVDVLLHTAQDNGAATMIKSTTPLVDNPANTSQLAKALHDSITFSGAFYESHVAAWSNGNRPLTELQKEPQAQLSQQMSSNPTDLLKSTDPLGSELGKIINLQLNTLEQQRVVWHGEAWPGQNMEWEISQDDAEKQQEQSEEERTPSWHSVVRFNFAHLGSVSASIHLIGQQIHMQVRTDNAMAEAALRTNSNMLSDSMAAAGSTLDSLIVKRDGET